MNQPLNNPMSQLHLKLIEHTCELLDSDVAFIVQLMAKSIRKYTDHLDKIQYTYIILRMIVLARSIVASEISITNGEMDTIRNLLKDIGEDHGTNSSGQTAH